MNNLFFTIIIIIGLGVPVGLYLRSLRKKLERIGGDIFDIRQQQYSTRKDLERETAYLLIAGTVRKKPERGDVVIEPFLWGERIELTPGPKQCVTIAPSVPLEARAVVMVLGSKRTKLDAVYIGHDLIAPFLGGGVPVAWTNRRLELGENLSIQLALD